MAVDDAVLAGLAKSDRHAFGLLYDRYADRVYRYCYRRLGSREAAEDATSQTFVKALAAIPDYREGGTFAGWLFAIAFSSTTDSLRRHRPTRSLDDLDERVASAPSPEDAALAAEERRGVRALLAALPPDQRRAMELRLGGLTGPEVAEAMGRSHQVVKMLQFRAIARLRALLGTDVRDDAGETLR